MIKPESQLQGDTRTSTYFGPYPTYMVKGEGCHLRDCDGNQYIDFLNNFTSLIHGHNHPAVVATTQTQLTKGIVFASAASVQADLAQIICERVPSIDLVRFTNSGTEATMMAMRTARAYTGKEIIIKMDGGYHGTHTFAEVNVTADSEGQDRPRAQIGSPGVPTCILDVMLVTRLNDLALTEELLKENKGKVAAIDQVSGLGDRLRDGFNKAFRTVGIKGRSHGFGSLVMIHWTNEPIETPKDVIPNLIA